MVVVLALLRWAVLVMHINKTLHVCLVWFEGWRVFLSSTCSKARGSRTFSTLKRKGWFNFGFFFLDVKVLVEAGSAVG